MAYKPTDTYIPCTTNGFIVEAYTKSYKFYSEDSKYPENSDVNGIIWIVDIEAMSKSDLNSAQVLAGRDFGKDPQGSIYYPFNNNYYAYSSLFSFPATNPKDGSDLHDPWNDIRTIDGVRTIIDDLGPSLKRVEYKELSESYSMDDFINLAISYLENSFKNIVYGRKKDPEWLKANSDFNDKKIKSEDLNKIYYDIGKKPENKISFKIGEKPPFVDDFSDSPPALSELYLKHISHDSDPPKKITFEVYERVSDKSQYTGTSSSVFFYRIEDLEVFETDPTTKNISVLLSEIERIYYYQKNKFYTDKIEGKSTKTDDQFNWSNEKIYDWLNNNSKIPKDTKYLLEEYTPKPEEKKPDDPAKAEKKVDPRDVVGKFILKVKSGPGVIIGINEVDIVDGKADFSGIEFDQPGDYVLTITSTSPDVDTTEISVKVAPPPEAIPQDSKGQQEETNGARPIIAQIDQPNPDLVGPMSFPRQGADDHATTLVASGVGVTPFLNYNGTQINDRDIQNFNLYHDGMIPKIDVIFRDSNGMISSEPPRDDTKFELFLQSKSPDLKSIHMAFKIEDFKRLPNSSYSLLGSMDISKLYRNKFMVNRGTSFETLREICKDLGLGFNSNIMNTNDNMPWRNIGDKQYKFMEDIVKHSYISDESFMAGYIDYYYCFNYVDIEKEMRRDISKDMGLDTGGIDGPDKKEIDKISRLVLVSDPGMQSSSNFFLKTAERNESTKISMEQGYKTKTKFYDKVKKMFLVFDVDSTTSDGSKSHILKAKDGDKEAFDNNYVTKYNGKIDTDNTHVNYNYAITQNRINLDNMMKNQMDIVLPNPNFNLYRFQKIEVILVNQVPSVSNPEHIQWRYSGEWLIASLGFSFKNGSMTQNITLTRKEMGKNPEEIKEGTKNATKEKKEEAHENPIVGSFATIKPNDKYKVGDVFTVQDSDQKRYILTITKISENGNDVVATLRDPNVVVDKTLTNPDTISGMSQSTATVDPPKTEPIVASASFAYPYTVTFEKQGGNTMVDEKYDKDGKLKGDPNQYIVDTEDFTQVAVAKLSSSYPTYDGTKTITREQNIKESDDSALWLAIKRPVPTFKPKKDEPYGSPNWVLFKLYDEGVNYADSVGKSNAQQDKKLWQKIKSRLFYGHEARQSWAGEGYEGDWKVPNGYIKIMDESGKVIDDTSKTWDPKTKLGANSDWNIDGQYGSDLTFQYPILRPPLKDPSPEGWYDANGKVADDEAYPMLSLNVISIDLSNGPIKKDENGNIILKKGDDGVEYSERGKRYEPGVYTIEVTYYVPLYEKLNSDGDNKDKPYNGTGGWYTKEERSATVDAEGYHPYEKKVLKETFTIAKKSKKL